MKKLITMLTVFILSLSIFTSQTYAKQPKQIIEYYTIIEITPAHTGYNKTDEVEYFGELTTNDNIGVVFYPSDIKGSKLIKVGTKVKVVFIPYKDDYQLVYISKVK